MKKLLALLTVVLVLICPMGLKAEDALDAAAESLLEGMETGALEDYADTYTDLSFREFIVLFIRGNFSTLFRGLKDSLQDMVAGVFSSQRRDMKELFAILILTALIGPVCGSIGSGSAGKMVSFAVQVLCLTLCADTYRMAASSMTETVDIMVGFMQTLLPVISGLFMSFGNTVTGGFIQPAVLMSAAAAATVIKTLVVPLLSGYVFLTALQGLGRDFPLKRLKDLLKSLVNILVGVTGSAFAGGLTVLGLSGAFVDGVAMKSVKFATRSFIPVVGGVFADSFEMLLSCGALVKNGLGIFGLAVLISICAVPLLKLLLLSLGMRLAAALSEPLSTPGVSGLLDGFADAIKLLLIVEAAVAILFFAELSILMAMGSAMVFAR